MTTITIIMLCVTYLQYLFRLKRKRGGLIFQSRDYAVVKRRAAEAVWVAESLPPLRLILN